MAFITQIKEEINCWIYILIQKSKNCSRLVVILSVWLKLRETINILEKLWKMFFCSCYHVGKFKKPCSLILLVIFRPAAIFSDLNFRMNIFYSECKIFLRYIFVYSLTYIYFHVGRVLGNMAPDIKGMHCAHISRK